jgi:plastocyanin
MRAKFLLAGLVVVLAACEKKADTPAADTTAMAPAPAPAAGTTHDVNMVLEGSEYKFVPATLTIKAGDVVRFHDVSGGPHNVQFFPDSIPGSAASVLDANMTDRMGPLAGPMVETGGTYTVSFAGAPVGDYKYFCLPHQAMGMKGQITVQ